MKHPKNYVKVTKWGYELYVNNKQIGVGVGLNIFQFLDNYLPKDKIGRKMAQKGIFLTR